MSDKFPRSLTAPVDEETYAWFKAQAEAEDRTPGAHLRRLILAHRDAVDTVDQRFATAVERQILYTGIPITPSEAERAEVYAHHPLPEDDPDEGVS